jgi:hypothetical protein
MGPGLSISREFFVARSDHAEITHKKFQSKFRRIPPSGVSYDVVALSTATYSRPVWGKADWSVYGVSGLSKNRIQISNGLLRRSITDDNKYIISFLKHLRKLGMRVCVIEGPRPFRHNIEVRRTGLKLVKHIDSLYQSVTLDILSRENIPIVAVPETTIDEDGFMLDQFRHANPRDKTHGNVDFGAVMMREVIAHLQNLE